MQNDGYRATAVISGIHAARLALQGMSEPIAEYLPAPAG
jgi:hypothetical protein